MDYSTAEMMAVAAARVLKNEDVCFVGIGAPSVACNLARLTHAPEITLIYESGTKETKPDVLPLSIGDPELSESRGDIEQRTGWPISFADEVEHTPTPTGTELALLRGLHARTELAHTGKVLPHA